jgi:type I restriction enzyme S subunit
MITLANPASVTCAHAALRDTLLPKLISGALRIQDAEAFLKERGL